MTQDYDLIVIGGGPAGYTAAIRGAQLGFETLCIDERPGAGGTCLNVGCIPSKALLASSERVERARSESESHGIRLGPVEVDLERMMRRKDEVVAQLTSGVDGLLEKNGATRVQARGALGEDGRVRVEDDAGKTRELRAEHVVLATGSRPVELPDLPADHRRILLSDDALALPEVPEHLAVVGGGYIGLELGSVWRRLGARVTVIEQEARVLPQMDAELSERVQQSLEEQGIEFRLECGVEDATRDADGSDEGRALSLRLSDTRQGLHCSHVLVAVGREPRTDGLGLERAGIERDERGFVRTAGRFRTSRPGVYAIGDVACEPMLAHKGQLEGLACVEAIAGLGAGHVDYEGIPAVVYTWPEVASLGRTERALQEAGVRFRIGRADFRHDARALCTGEARGFAKLLVEEGSGRLLGAQIFAPDAGTLVHELLIARELGGSMEEVGRCVHAHPTLNETLREAALDASGRALHH